MKYDYSGRVLNRARSQYLRKASSKTRHEELSLYQMYKNYNLTDEDMVKRFFDNIRRKPNNKDNFIRDFDEYYFKVRPKFIPKLIKIFLEVRVNLKFKSIYREI